MEPEPSRQSTRSIFPLQAKVRGRQQKKKKARSDTRWEGNIGRIMHINQGSRNGMTVQTVGWQDGVGIGAELTSRI